MGEEWFATHAAGFGPLVARLALRDCPGASARADGDNALRLSLGGGAARGAAPKALLSYCRGLFRVLGEAPGGLERASRTIAATGRLDSPLAGSRDPGRGRGMPRTFVLRSFGPDDPAAIPVDARRAIEALIARATGMRPDSERPEREFRLQERAGGSTLFLERSSEAAVDPARPGELPRTTCRLLAEMSSPQADDVFLDPFCGYGGIVLERALAGPYRFAFASDNEAGKVAAVKASLSAKAFEKRRKTIFPKLRDALDPSGFDPGFVTAIVTDPPWGLYEAGMGREEAGALLRAFLAEAARLLARGGRLVLLVARSLDAAAEAEAVADSREGKAALAGAAARAEEGGRSRSAFLLRESLDVLVSGKKARVLRLDRA